jgi:hypothetical protein
MMSFRVRSWCGAFVSGAGVVAPLALASTKVRAQSEPHQPSVVTTAFVNVTVVPMDTERLLPGQTVVVKDGRITAVGPSREVAIPAGVMRIDGKGRYLMPGLTDCHTHATQFAPNVAESEQRLLRWLSHGVTTIRNLDYSHDSDAVEALSLKARAAAGELWSPRIYTSGIWWGKSKHWREVSPAAVAPLIAAYKAAGYDFIKLRSGEQGEIADSVLVAAHREGLPITGHVWIELDRVLAPGGYRAIEHLEGYIPDYLMRFSRGMSGGVKRDSAALAQQREQLDLSKIPAIAAATRQAGVWNCPTQIFYELSAREGGGLGEFAQVALLDARRQLIKALQDSGAGLLVGSDAGSDAVHLRTVPQELQELVRAGLTPYQALAAGTRSPAQFFGILDSAGTIAVGKRADLIVTRANPLADVRNVRRPLGVMAGGRWFSREALDHRRASEVSTRKAYYQEYLNGVYEADLLYPLLQPWVTDGLGRNFLTVADRAPIRERWAAHRAQHAALIDSLLVTGGATPDETKIQEEQQRMVQLVGRQVAELRAAVPPAGQARFDSLARAWEQQYLPQGTQARKTAPAP